MRSARSGREACVLLEIFAVRLLGCSVVREGNVDYVVRKCTQCGVIWHV